MDGQAKGLTRYEMGGRIQLLCIFDLKRTDEVHEEMKVDSMINRWHQLESVELSSLLSEGSSLYMGTAGCEGPEN